MFAVCALNLGDSATHGNLQVLGIKRYLRSFIHKNEHMFKKMNFITPTSLNVLYFLLSNPMEQFHEREIVRRTGVSVGAVNQILRRFQRGGLVEKDRRGKTNLYRAILRN